MDLGLLEKKNETMKIAVLGKGMVGKSSLTYKYINYNTPKDHDPTIEDKYSTVVTVDGISCDVEILDTAGQDDYQSLMNYWISFGEAFVLVYAINNKESFLGLEEKREKILKMKKDEIPPIVLVGNKSDLENQRAVPFDEAKDLARRWNCGFFETSVFADRNCKDPFNSLVKIMLTKKRKNSNDEIITSKKNSCCQRCDIY